MHKAILTKKSFFLFLTSLLIPSCGGFNTGEKDPDGELGARVSVGDIAVVPDSEHFILGLDNELIYGSISTGELENLDTIDEPERVLFSENGSTAYLGTGEKLIAYDLIQKTTLWEIEKSNINFRISEATNKTVVTSQNTICLHALDTGIETSCITLEEVAATLDIDILESSQRTIITTHILRDTGEEDISVITELIVLSLVSNEAEPFAPIERISNLPSCATNLSVLPDESKAILSSALCEVDAVTAIHLDGTEPQIVNLPGIGTVEVATDGNQIISFVDATRLDPTDFPNPEQIPSNQEARYHLAIIDGETLDVQTTPVGPYIPRFKFTPNSRYLLIDEGVRNQNDFQIQRLNIETLQSISIQGPDVRLNNFVLTNDSSKIFLLDNGLHRLNVEEGTVERITLDFNPTHIAITHDSTSLILREDDVSIRIFDVQSGEIIQQIRLQPEN